MSITELKRKLQSINILVSGDAILDKYWFGDVFRISPEAPVPILKVQNCEHRLGGASNVAVNIKSLGANVAYMGIVGHDLAARQMEDLLEKHNIQSFLQMDDTIRTTEKLRLIARRQQILRADFETTPSQKSIKLLLNTYIENISKFDAVILSDYGKGGLQNIVQMIEIANNANKIILIDPKGNDFDRYKGATIITPNRSELTCIIGTWNSEAELFEKAQNLRKRLSLKAILLTRSEEGMTLFTDRGSFSVSAEAREVFDVSGAGDTVIAVMAVMLAMNVNYEKAVNISNRAGGIVVGKFGTAPITFDELFVKSL